MDTIQNVRVILQNDKGEILFLKRRKMKRASGEWTLPGGKIDSGERAEESCIREIKEETNLDIFNIKFLFQKINPRKGKTDKNYLVLYFKADYSGEIKINEESSEYAWINLENIKKTNIAFNQKEVIKEFIEKFKI